MKYFAVCVIINIFVVAASAMNNGSPDQGEFRISFALIQDNQEVVYSCNADSKLPAIHINSKKKEETFSVFFQPLKNAYLYLLLFTPDDYLHQIFPCSFTDFYNATYNYRHYLPGKDKSWNAMMTIAGKYELILIIVTKRQLEMEKKINECRDLSSQKSNNKQKINERRMKINTLKQFISETEMKLLSRGNLNELPANPQGGIRNEGNEIGNNLMELRRPDDADDPVPPGTGLTKAGIIEQQAVTYGFTSIYVREFDLEYK